MSTSPAAPGTGAAGDRQTNSGQRRRLDLPVPQRLRRLRLGGQADGTRGRKYVYGKTREEVHDKWIKLQAQAKAGPVATTSADRGRFMAYWLREIVEPNSAPLTYATYETLTRLYIVPGLGHKRLDNRLSVQDVQMWLNKTAKTCTCCAQGKDARRPPERRRCCAIGKCCQALPSRADGQGIRAVLRSALSQALVEELVSRNVAAPGQTAADAHGARASAWTSDEARRFLESSRAGGDYLYAAYVLVLVLGLRKGEVLGLTWDHVDWAGWDKPCDEHGAEFCADCRDGYDIGLRIDKQLQRVRADSCTGRPRPRSPTRRCRCPPSA